MHGLQLILPTLGPAWQAMLFRTARPGRFGRFYNRQEWQTVQSRRRMAKAARRKNRRK